MIVCAALAVATSCPSAGHDKIVDAPVRVSKRPNLERIRRTDCREHVDAVENAGYFLVEHVVAASCRDKRHEPAKNSSVPQQIH
jgi:hypothetical protein